MSDLDARRSLERNAIEEGPMPTDRLSALDASFLAAESPTAHMHVGWAAVFDPPAEGARPSFEALREHVARRLARSRRYRQRLKGVPFGVHDPVWVDDQQFDLDHHVVRSDASQLSEVVDQAMSAPLVRSRPLWELWIAPRLSDDRVGVVGKAHHCMVDGLAAVELAALLLDPEEHPGLIDPGSWEPHPPPGWVSLLAHALADRAREQLELLRWPALALSSPVRLAELLGDTRRAASALAHAFATAAPRTSLNEPISSLRHLAMVARPLAELREIKDRHETTINDVVLAASAGAVGRFLEDRGEPPVALKAMVPVSVRGSEDGSLLGNKIAFIFVRLPCDERDPVRRLIAINRVTRERKQAGEQHGADAVLSIVSHTPHLVQRALTRLVTSPSTFNLVVSNIPGPRAPLYMHGCRLAEAYPVVPLADRHTVSIGVTTVTDRACFGLYADPRSLPDADLLAHDLDREIDELLIRSTGDNQPASKPRSRRPLATAPRATRDV
jgi:diacylglycerol O-acyltransferase